MLKDGQYGSGQGRCEVGSECEMHPWFLGCLAQYLR